jgi:hypothetical protein
MRRIRRWLLIGLSLVILLVGAGSLLFSGSRRVTRANFEKIQTGMSREAVDALLGRESMRQMAVTSSGGHGRCGHDLYFLVYSEQDLTSLIPADTIELTFIDGKVRRKAFNTWTVGDWWARLRNRIATPRSPPPVPAPPIAAQPPSG